MTRPKIRITLNAEMLDKLADNSSLTFKVGEQLYEVRLEGVQMRLIWSEDGSTNLCDLPKLSYTKNPSEMN